MVGPSAVSLALLVLATCLSMPLLGLAGSFDWMKLPGEMKGRLEMDHHAPRCCYAHDCLAKDKGNYAFVTTLRTKEYLILLRELHCSLMKHNPGSRLVVVGVIGEMEAWVIQEVRALAHTEWREVEDFVIPNKTPRFMKNWFELRLWGLTDFDAIAIIDADSIVLGDLTHVFKLPTDFAWAPDAGPGVDYEEGAFMFVRPCAAVADHMMALALNNKRLHFESRWAEQSFIEWYNRYSGLRLDSMYCCDPELLRKTHNRTAGGADPLVLHFAFNKPFEIGPEDHRWEWMCYRPQLAQRAKEAHMGRQEIAVSHHRIG